MELSNPKIKKFLILWEMELPENSLELSEHEK